MMARRSWQVQESCVPGSGRPWGAA